MIIIVILILQNKFLRFLTIFSNGYTISCNVQLRLHFKGRVHCFSMQVVKN